MVLKGCLLLQVERETVSCTKLLWTLNAHSARSKHRNLRGPAEEMALLLQGTYSLPLACVWTQKTTQQKCGEAPGRWYLLPRWQ